ncbi:hypothetical protein ACFOJE_12565 [Azotobacter bryophylli]|uniref:Uncharacterized protein n=1 Tax=Azotobacter bryophylli TaxID=1986537 RepID=A0ABV7AW21_9GAMM
MTTSSKAVLSALEQAQDILARWFEPDGISAEQAMNEVLPILDNKKLVRAQRQLWREIGDD